MGVLKNSEGKLLLTASKPINVSEPVISFENEIIEGSLSAYENSAVTSIRGYAFYGCSNLTSVSFPACTTIGSNAFYSCSSLTTINFPACTTVGSTAFRGCSNLTSVSFPACTIIYSNAFYSCYQLESVYLLGSSVPLMGGLAVFGNTPISKSTYLGGYFGSIIVKSEMLSAFQSATNWSVYSSRFSVWNGTD